MQKSDFIGIYKAMKELPVTVRLLDPPLHEFLPSEPEDIKSLAEDMGMSVEEMEADIEGLKNSTPCWGTAAVVLP